MKTGSLKFNEIGFFEKLTAKNPEYVHALVPLAEAYTVKGLYEKGLKIDQQLARLCPGDPVIHYNLACSYALVGNKEQAMQSLERAVRLGYSDFDHLKKDRDLAILHKDPAFKALWPAKSKTRKK